MALRSALPSLQRVLARTSEMVAAEHRSRAIGACALLLTAAVRLCTEPAGKSTAHPLLRERAAVDFLDLDGRDGAARSAPRDLRHPDQVARHWIKEGLGPLLGARDARLAEAAAWAIPRVLQADAMAPLREAMAPRVAEAFLRALPVRQVKTGSQHT